MNFREPALYDEETGLYVTATQLKFFLNGPNAALHMENNTIEFILFVRKCQLFNLVYDTNEGIICWDEDAEELKVVLAGVNADEYIYEEDYDDDDKGEFLDLDWKY